LLAQAGKAVSHLFMNAGCSGVWLAPCLLTSEPGTSCRHHVQVFGSAFRRNSRWSVNQPVPELGADDAPMDKARRQTHARLAFGHARQQHKPVHPNTCLGLSSACPDADQDSCLPALITQAQVDAFYNFWYSFKSWREFPHPDEEDTEQVRRSSWCLSGGGCCMTG
jgi:hypothetical protein